jgi:predicted cupin superfamily sugar epimerase
VTRPALAEALDLEPHPEGGWYRRTWASPVSVTLPDGRVRRTATLIHFLLPAGESSAWHRVSSDELWIAQQGCRRGVMRW